MAFIQPCFIRKNTEELRKKLEDLGYKRNSPDYTLDSKLIFCYVYPMKGFDTPSYVVANAFDLPFDEDSALRGKFIDCGENEDLFLALATLRDDTDNNQLFTNGKGDWCIYRDDTEKGGLAGFEFYGLPMDTNYDNYHKATVEEIVEHFKTNES